jgi:hypothetical protein
MHIYVYQYVNKQMGVFCDRLKLGSTAALDCRTGQNKGRYSKEELLFLVYSLSPVVCLSNSTGLKWFMGHFGTATYIVHSISTQTSQEERQFTKAKGGIQLEFVSISQVINHMTCYNPSALIG